MLDGTGMMNYSSADEFSANNVKYSYNTRRCRSSWGDLCVFSFG